MQYSTPTLNQSFTTDAPLSIVQCDHIINFKHANISPTLSHQSLARTAGPHTNSIQPYGAWSLQMLSCFPEECSFCHHMRSHRLLNSFRKMSYIFRNDFPFFSRFLTVHRSLQTNFMVSFHPTVEAGHIHMGKYIALAITKWKTKTTSLFRTLTWFEWTIIRQNLSLKKKWQISAHAQPPPRFI